MTLFEAIKQQRIGLACALLVAVVLITVVHAPAVPVTIGCLLSLTYLIFKLWSRSSTGPRGG
jgi:hypothetical protein